MSRIYPGHIRRVKIFEAYHACHSEDDGIRYHSSEPTLEDMINSWVIETRNLIVGIGPVNPECQVDKDNKVIGLRRHMAVIYVAPVEQSHGRQTSVEDIAPGQIPGMVEAVDAGSPGAIERASKVDSGNRGRLRLPTLPK